jgi:hypothetical protein
MPRTGSCARTRTSAKLPALTKTEGFRAIANANSVHAALKMGLRSPQSRRTHDAQQCGTEGPFQNPAGRLATETADFCNKIGQ